MYSKASFEIGGGSKAVNPTSQPVIGNSNNESKGFEDLKKGQLITGTVVSVDFEVTLAFGAQEVKASKEVLMNAVPGEIKTFEVMKTSGNEIELRLLDGDPKDRKKVFKAAMVLEKDIELLIGKKDQTNKKEETNKLFRDTMSKLEEIGIKLTEADCVRLEAEGFPLENMTVKGLYSALNRIKESIEQEKTSDKTAIHGQPSNDQIEISLPMNKKRLVDKIKITVKQINKQIDKPVGRVVDNSSNITDIAKGDKEEIAKRLQMENLPSTDENINLITKALELSKTVTLMDDKTTKSLIDQGAEPTIENIYKAFYSGNSMKREQPLSEKAWGELQTQVKEVIQAAHYELNEENLISAKWLLENQLPLTEDTFTYKKELEKIKTDTNPEVILDKIIEGMKEGRLPKHASLADDDKAVYQRIIKDVHSIRRDTVIKAVKEGTDITLKRLLTIQETLEYSSNSDNTVSEDTAIAGMDLEDLEDLFLKEEAELRYKEEAKLLQRRSKEANSTSQSVDVTYSTSNKAAEEVTVAAERESRYTEIKTRRQLEEIRLKMTVEAAAKLEKKGFSIETKPLEEVVNALRELENSYYRQLFTEAEVKADDQSVELLKNTTQSVQQLKFIPSHVLGITLAERGTQTIPSLLSEGNKLQAQLTKAGTAYETLMTVPNSEYGDSIKKAFGNMGSLLLEIKIENTEQNQRAVRILAYNHMDITQESIDQVKAYDLEVNTLMQNLHPAVTVRMIKEGINPLEMPITELNKKIEQMKEEQGITSEEKFSTYLRKLDKNNGITPEERKAYIGIYRLLYNVEKTDGAALGTVINTGREVTLDHLLSAVRIQKKGSLDAVIDDEFGSLSNLEKKGETISDQLNLLTQGAEENGREQENEKFTEQTQYLNRILKQMKEELTPDKLQEISQQLLHGKEAVTTNASARLPKLSAGNGIWETLKDVPIEKLYDQLSNARGENPAEDPSYTTKVQEIRELCRNSEQSIRFLNDFKVPSTPLNIMLTNQLLSNGESVMKKLLRQHSENIVENSENIVKEIEELSDKLIDKQSMQEVYEQLESDTKAALSKACSEETLDSRRLTELKSIGQQMTFLKTLAGKEYYQIPIETEGGITNLNLTILRGSNITGKVAVTMQSEGLGSVKADFTLKDNVLKGYISCDNRDGLAKLQEKATEIEHAVKEKEITLKQMDFILQKRANDTYQYQNPEKEETGSSINADTERTLYRLAKAVIQTVRLAERSETNRFAVPN